MLSKKHPSRVYADAVVAKKINAPKYVVKQCKKFNKIANNRDKRYRINEDRVDLIDGMLDLMIMPKGLAIGKTIKEAMAGFQGFLSLPFYALCTKMIRNADDMKLQYWKSAGKMGKRF